MLLNCGKVNHSDTARHLVGLAQYLSPVVDFRFGGSQPWLHIGTTLQRKSHAWNPPGNSEPMGLGWGRGVCPLKQVPWFF